MNHEPFAAASLGQVHKATIKSTGEVIALKIQYPGVESAIETDLSFLKTFFKMIDLIPTHFQHDEIYNEIKIMLHQELDYTKELQFTQYFYNLLKSDSRYICARPYPEFSSSNRRIARSIDVKHT